MKTKPTAIITGATGAIGTAIARQMAEKNYRVFVVARNKVKAQQTVEHIKSSTGNTDVDFLRIDVSRKSSIADAAKKWNGPLNVLINNAALTPRHREETPEGIEMQFATNVLGYFWMIKYFTPFLKIAPDARIVNVASYWAGDLNINDLECKSHSYNNDTIYRQSKQADRMLSVAFAQKLKADGITVNAVHPGDVNSKLSNDLGYGGHESPDRGADTPVWAATAPELKSISGTYFEHRQEISCRFGKDQLLVNKLFDICANY
jgi:retinol dehydrogenase-13